MGVVFFIYTPVTVWLKVSVNLFFFWAIVYQTYSNFSQTLTDVMIHTGKTFFCVSVMLRSAAISRCISIPQWVWLICHKSVISVSNKNQNTCYLKRQVICIFSAKKIWTSALMRESPPMLNITQLSMILYILNLKLNTTLIIYSLRENGLLVLSQNDKYFCILLIIPLLHVVMLQWRTMTYLLCYTSQTIQIQRNKKTSL